MLAAEMEAVGIGRFDLTQRYASLPAKIELGSLGRPLTAQVRSSAVGLGGRPGILWSTTFDLCCCSSKTEIDLDR